MAERARFARLAFLVGVLALALYGPSLGNGFTYDDRVVVVENRFITDLANLPQLLSSSYFERAQEKTWRPVTTLSYFIDHAFWGKRPFGYHLTNVLLHSASAALVVLILGAWGSPRLVAFLGGLIFAVHPVATAVTESVAFRDDLLAWFFVGLALLFYRASTRREGPWSVGLLLAPLFFGLGCLAKESAVVMPLLAVGLDWLVEGRSIFDLDRQRARALAGLAAVGALYLALRFGPMAGPLESFRYMDGSPLVAAMTAPSVIFRAVKLLVFPTALSPVRWVEPVRSLANHLALGGIGLLVGSGLLGWWARKRNPRVSAALVWMAIAWLPVSGAIPLTHPLADRYLYMPLLGFSWLLAEGLAAVVESQKRPYRFLGLVLALGLLVSGTVLTLDRHRDWKDELSLWRSAVANEPASYRAHYNLADALYKRGRFKEAEKAYRQALALKPVFSLGHYSLGRLLYRTGRKEEAALQFSEAIADRPDYAEAHNHLGIILAEKGLFRQARQAYEAALRVEPNHARALNNLGILLARQGRWNEAEKLFRRATIARPDDPTSWANLGVLLSQMGRYEEARHAFRRSLSLRPDFAPALKGLESLPR